MMGTRYRGWSSTALLACVPAYVMLMDCLLVLSNDHASYVMDQRYDGQSSSAGFLIHGHLLVLAIATPITYMAAVIALRLLTSDGDTCEPCHKGQSEQLGLPIVTLIASFWLIITIVGENAYVQLVVLQNSNTRLAAVLLLMSNSRILFVLLSGYAVFMAVQRMVSKPRMTGAMATAICVAVIAFRVLSILVAGMPGEWQ